MSVSCVILYTLAALFSLKGAFMIKRKDNKGRVLKDGEMQRSDGRYSFQYKDAMGKRKIVYSWKLLPADKIPAGKRKDLSLREKESQIKEDLSAGIVPRGGNMTVYDLAKKYVSQKNNVKSSTKSNYYFVLNVIKNESIGACRIDKINISDAKSWISGLQERGRGYSSIHAIHSVLNPAFKMALDSDLIRKNPFSFKLPDAVFNDSSERECISDSQEKVFLEFVKMDSHYKKYYEAIYILFHTGLRISEFCGLTISDIDFENKKIIVDHQLQRRHGIGYEVTETKTVSGKRDVPMTEDVADCFKNIIKSRKAPKTEPMIGGKTGFLFLDANGMPKVASHWEKYFRNILKKYNSSNSVQLPTITPHICRHTFCSQMARSGMNPKTLQYIMGHSSINVTLNVYTHIKFENAQEEMEKIIKIG